MKATQAKNPVSRIIEDEPEFAIARRTRLTPSMATANATHTARGEPARSRTHIGAISATKLATSPTRLIIRQILEDLTTSPVDTFQPTSTG